MDVYPTFVNGVHRKLCAILENLQSKHDTQSSNGHQGTLVQAGTNKSNCLIF